MLADATVAQYQTSNGNIRDQGNFIKATFFGKIRGKWGGENFSFSSNDIGSSLTFQQFHANPKILVQTWSLSPHLSPKKYVRFILLIYFFFKCAYSNPIHIEKYNTFIKFTTTIPT